MNSISFQNGIKIEFHTRGEEFLGMGAIQAGDTLLRSGRRPMFVEIRNPSGIALTDFRTVDEQRGPDGLVLEMSAKSRAAGMMEWMVHEVRNRYNTADWTGDLEPAQNTRLRLEVRPVTRRLGSTECVGLRYQYHYHSESIPIYKILDRGTWEIGGHAVGSEFWMRNCFVPAIVEFRSVQQFHSTEWYLPDATNPNVFQFLPLQTELQGFTFTSSNAGTLITRATEVAHVRSLFEKPRGQDEIVHWHEHCGDLGNEFHTSPIEVLWAPGSLDRVGRANLYEAIRDLCHEELHNQVGMKRERVTTYGQIEEWGPADLERYRNLGLPKLLDAGVKTVGLANHFENNMNVWGVSNMCCTVDYKVAESVGEQKLAAFCEDAAKGGARVEMWGNTSVSTLTLKFDEHDAPSDRIRFLPREGSVMEALRKSKDPWVRNMSNAIEADHYTPSFAVMNLRDEVVRDYWMKSWGYAHDKVGIAGIFLDSSFNLSSDKFHYIQNTGAGMSGGTADQTHLLGHYRPAIEPPQAILSQYRAHLDLMAAMQRAGYQYCNEDLGVFGLHRHGPGIHARLDSLPIWQECICTFDRAEIEKAGADPDDIFFRGLAYRMMWILCWDIRNDRLTWHYAGRRIAADDPSPWQLALLKAFNEVNDLMANREILPGETGVIYRAGNRQVLWAFTPMTLPLAVPSTVRDVLAGSEETMECVQAQARRIYIIER